MINSSCRIMFLLKVTLLPVDAFRKLSPALKDAYLKLYGYLPPRAVSSPRSAQPTELELKVFSIFKADHFSGNVVRYSSRFNHSCIPNTQLFMAGTKINPNFHFRVFREIKVGEELFVCQNTSPSLTELHGKQS